MKKVMGLMLGSCLMVQPAVALNRLDDSQLRSTTGQALIEMTSRNGGNNSQNSGIGFQRLTLNAEVDLNANIRKVQLGCGGVNGSGGCDIDIDYLSLSGLQESSSNARVQSDARITNPFLEFAVKNPGSLASREIVGFRLGSAGLNGLLTTGLENSTTPNGINALSGYLKIQSDSSGLIKGYANTDPAWFDAGANVLQGKINAQAYLPGCNWVGILCIPTLKLTDLAQVAYKSAGGGFNIPALTNLPFNAAGLTINGSRRTAVNINTTINVPTVYVAPGNSAAGTVTLDGNGTTTSASTSANRVPMVITDCGILACVVAPNGKTFYVDITGQITNIKVNANIQESLGNIHRIALNSPLSLSLQKQALYWPGQPADDIAQKGWWLSLSNPINLGNVLPSNNIQINPIFPALATAISSQLQSSPASTSDFAGLLGFTSTLQVGIGSRDMSSSPLNLGLNNLKLDGQNIVSNCYGGLRFC